MSDCLSACCSATSSAWNSGQHPAAAYFWHGHSCYWDSFPGGMSAVLRGLILNLGALQTTDLESIIVSGSPANRIWLNHNMLSSPSAVPFDAAITHSQTTSAVATIRTGSRTDTGTANITIDQLKVGLRGYIVHPYARDTPGNVYTPVATPAYTGTIYRRGNSRQVHFRIIPSFRLTINSLSVNTPGSTASAL